MDPGLRARPHDFWGLVSIPVGGGDRLSRGAAGQADRGDMKSRVQGMRTWAAAAAAGATSAFWGVQAFADELMGQPTPGGIGLQPAASPLKHAAHDFHDWILMPIITFICLLVLGLLLWCVIRYNKRSNPIPAKWSHNTLVEIVWTVVPVLILMAISVVSFKLLFAYHDMPKPDLTVKATGYQWYWGYELPDQRSASSFPTCFPKTKPRRATFLTAWPPPSRSWFRSTRPSACWSPAPTSFTPSPCRRSV